MTAALLLCTCQNNISVCAPETLTYLSPGPNDGQFLHGGGTLVVQLGAGFACVELGQRRDQQLVDAPQVIQVASDTAAYPLAANLCRTAEVATGRRYEQNVLLSAQGYLRVTKKIWGAANPARQEAQKHVLGILIELPLQETAGKLTLPSGIRHPHLNIVHGFIPVNTLKVPQSWNVRKQTWDL